MVPFADMDLCSICININLENARFYVLQNSASMKNSAEDGCLGCDFFIESTERHLKWDKEKFAAVGFKVQLYRIDMDDSPVDLKFYTGPDDGNKAYVHAVVPLRLCSRYGFEPAFTADYKGPDNNFLGRLIAKSSRDPECLDLASAWIERCSRSHHSFCYPQADVILPTRVIRIPSSSDQKLQLQTTEGLKGRYVALSYCWGNENTFVTTKVTLKNRQDGFQVELLPKTLQDAIYISRKLGFEYIWIDALCIIQEDTEDWAHESSKMAQVYGNASLTLCADLAREVDEGILRPRNTLRSHSFGPSGNFCLQTRGLGWATLAAVYAGRVHNPLSLRGWALQERCLSSRILHFLDEQIAWECRTTVYMEEVRYCQDYPPYHFSNREWSQSLRSARVKNKLTVESQLSAWCFPMQELAVRNFTNSSDRLPSVSGFASAIEIPELGNYLAGVWENCAFSCMAWFPRYSQPAIPVYRAPSWSWASIERQIIYFHKAFLNVPSFFSFIRPDGHVLGEPVEKVRRIVSDWDAWAAQFHPQLLEHHMIPKSMDPKGEVLEGSYVVISGYCRNIHVMDNPNTTFNEWEILGDGFQGRKALMDVRNNCESRSYFVEELMDLDPGIDKRQLKKYLCIIIAREKKVPYPKTVALVLTKVDGMGDNTFRRAGIFAFDQPRDKASEESKWEIDSKWKPRTVKLI